MRLLGSPRSRVREGAGHFWLWLATVGRSWCASHSPQGSLEWTENVPERDALVWAPTH